MMHNGGVENFSTIKCHLRKPLTDDLYNWIKGQTDSEHLFAYLLNYLYQHHTTIGPEAVMDAFEHTFTFLKKLMTGKGIHEPAYLNMVVTNGLFIVGTRYVTDPKEEALTLYYTEGARYGCENGVCRMLQPSEQEEAVLVVSEKLTDETKDWKEIPKNHFCYRGR